MKNKMEKGFRFIISALILLVLSCESGINSLSDNSFSKSSLLKNNTLIVEIESVNSDIITFSMTNNSPEKIQIAEYDTVFTGFKKDLFLIYHNDKKIDYTGRIFYPIEKNFVDIDPAEKKEIVVKLSDAYDLSKVGIYEVIFNTFVDFKIQGEECKIIETYSNTIELSITNPLVKIKEEITACSADFKNLLDESKIQGSKIARNSVKHLAKFSNDDFYLKWLGAYTDERFNFVTNGYDNTVISFNKEWTYSCENRETSDNCGGTLAWVYKSRPQEVWVCMNHFENDPLGFRGEVMLHEAVHWNVNFSANDHVYGKSGSLELAKTNPDNAIRNADTLRFFAADIPMISDPEPPIVADIKMNKSTFEIGERIDVIYSDLPGNVTDWIGIYNVEDPYDQYIQRAYTDGYKQGTVTFGGIEIPGKYQARLFFSDSFNLEDDVDFIVKDETDPPVDLPTFKLNKEVYKKKQSIKIIYKNLPVIKKPGSSKHWFGVFKRGETKVIQRKYARKNKANGCVRMKKLKKHGEYDMRLFINDSSDMVYEVQFSVKK